METNFFKSLAAIDVQGEWNITIHQDASNIWVVSVYYKDPLCSDVASKIIPPINLKGTAEELDSGFFASITEPIKTTAQLFVNMENYMKQQEQALIQSKMTKEKTERETKVKTEKERKLEAALKKVEELEADGKYQEAWMKIPEPSEYPEQAAILRERKENLSAHFAPNLFNT